MSTMKRSPGMHSEFPTPTMSELFTAVKSLETEEEIAAFFRDLLTLPEITEFANRWQIVKALNRGQSYQKIAKQLNVSTTTVTRVAYWLRHGMGGYAKAAERILKK